MHEQLLGYLLEVLEPADRAFVEAKLRDDPVWREELERLRESLKPLHYDDDPVPEPPTGLARRTLDFVFVNADALERVSPAPAAWRAVDFIVVGCICMAAFLLIAPAISMIRFQAEIAACQTNLRKLGVALSSYSQFHVGFFPYMETHDRLTGAATYGPILFDGGFLDDERVMVCPSSALAESDFRIPSLDSVRNASPGQLAELTRRMGGSYGYAIGNFLNGRYFPPQNFVRNSVALASDSPTLYLPGFQSANHGGRGQNVLFESGRVTYLRLAREIVDSDDIFKNNDGFLRPGVTLNDAVLTHSSVVPMISAGDDIH